jgi:hypothetical protein
MNGASALFVLAVHLALLSSISFADSPPSCRMSASSWSPVAAG